MILPAAQHALRWCPTVARDRSARRKGGIFRLLLLAQFLDRQRSARFVLLFWSWLATSGSFGFVSPKEEAWSLGQRDFPHAPHSDQSPLQATSCSQKKLGMVQGLLLVFPWLSMRMLLIVQLRHVK